MKNKRMFSGLCVAMIALILFACGSTINGTGTANRNQTGSDAAGFDPSVSSNLEVLPYEVIQNKLLINFQLQKTGTAYKTLTSNVSVFDIPDPKFSSLFQTTYTKIMSLACQEMATETFFPENKPIIDHAWVSLTGKAVTEGGAKDIEASILADTAGQTDDVKMFALCVAAALDARAEFINFRD